MSHIENIELKYPIDKDCSLELKQLIIDPYDEENLLEDMIDSDIEDEDYKEIIYTNLHRLRKIKYYEK